MQRQQAIVLFDLQSHRIQDRLGLTGALRCTKHEIVRQHGDLAQIQQGNGLRLLFFDERDDFAS
jgi:hypothetical protein